MNGFCETLPPNCNFVLWANMVTMGSMCAMKLDWVVDYVGDMVALCFNAPRERSMALPLCSANEPRDGWS